MKARGKDRAGSGSAPQPPAGGIEGNGAGSPAGAQQAPAERLSGARDNPPREERIAIIAYYKAQRRGFANSGELDDWLEAEREVDRQELEGGDGGTARP
jgi:hypothetical protein